MNRLAVLLWLALAASAQASTTVPVNLRPDLKAQLADEKAFKALIDEWSNPGLDIRFKARADYSLDSQGQVRVYLDAFQASTNPAWYQRFRTFHDQLVKKPYAPEVFRHAEAYCRTGAIFMAADCEGSGGQVLFRGDVHNVLSMSRAPDTQLFFFAHRDRAPMPPKSPPLTYLAHGSPGDGLYVDIPAAIAPAVTRIHLVDRPAAAWPVPLDGGASGVAPPNPPASRAGAPTLPQPHL